MAENYDSYCDSSDNMNHTLPQSNKICSEPHLYLNGKIFWCKFELPKVDGKRRFKRFSLRTDNYYEARQKIMDILEFYENIRQLDELYNQLKLNKNYNKDNDSKKLSYEYELNDDNDINLLKKIKSLFDECFLDDFDINQEVKWHLQRLTYVARGRTRMENDEKLRNDPEYKKELEEFLNRDVWHKNHLNVLYVKEVLDKVGKIIIQIQNVLYPQETAPTQNQVLLQPLPQTISMPNIPVAQPSAVPHYTIRQIIDKMLSIL